MNKLVKRGFSAYRIFLKNKLAMAMMMFIPGVMMFIGAMNGHGNDTVSMPLGITSAGMAFTFWALYRVGYIKAQYDNAQTREDKKSQKTTMILQILEAVVYLLVVAVGIFLLINQSFMDKVLNLMAGFFTTLNGVMGIIDTIKKRDHRNFRWGFKLILTVLELVLGPYFLIMSDGIETGWYLVMGLLTAVAGALEVIAALTPETLRSTIQDGKDIIKTLKDGKTEEEEEDEDEYELPEQQ